MRPAIPATSFRAEKTSQMALEAQLCARVSPDDFRGVFCATN